MPDAVEEHQEFNRPAMCEKCDVTFKPPFQESGQDSVSDKQPADGKCSNHWCNDEWQQRDKDYISFQSLERVVDSQSNGKSHSNHQRKGNEGKGQGEAKSLPEINILNLRPVSGGKSRESFFRFDQTSITLQSDKLSFLDDPSFFIEFRTGFNFSDTGLTGETWGTGFHFHIFENRFGQVETLPKYTDQRSCNEKKHEQDGGPYK